METLKNYLKENTEYWDGHIHLFDHSGTIDLSLIDTKYKCVCFADIVFLREQYYNNGLMVKYYDNFINKYYSADKHILLATGNNSEDIITIYKKYPNIIKGFGELKCYDKYKEGELPYANLNWIKQLLEFNKSINLPVYIHYDLDIIKHRITFEELLKKYDKMPIVLCHCGMVDNNDINKEIFDFIYSLIIKYNNLYLDISYTANKFLLNNKYNLVKLFNYSDKILCGTDLNPVIKTSEFVDNPKQYSINKYSELKLLSKYINNTNTIKKLFNLT